MKLTRKLFSLVLALATVISAFSISALPTNAEETFPALDTTKAYLQIGSASAFQGDTVKIPINLGNNPGLYSLRFKIKYDSTVLKLTNVEAGNIISKTAEDEFGFLYNTDFVANPFTIYADGSSITENVTTSGTFANLVFQVNTSAAITTTPVEFFNYIPDDYSNVAMENVPLTFGNGSVTVKKLTLAQPKLSVSLSGKSIKKLSAKLSYKAVAKADSYRIQRKKGSGSWQTIATTTKTSYTNSNLAAGVKFGYRVIATKGKTIQSKASTAKYVTTLSTSAPKVTVKSKAKKKSTVSWKAITGASGYQVYRSTKKSSGYKLVKTTKAKSFKDSKGLVSKKKRYYKVRAYITVGGKKVYGSYSKVKPIKIK